MSLDSEDLENLLCKDLDLFSSAHCGGLANGFSNDFSEENYNLDFLNICFASDPTLNLSPKRRSSTENHRPIYHSVQQSSPPPQPAQNPSNSTTCSNEFSETLQFLSMKSPHPFSHLEITSKLQSAIAQITQDISFGQKYKNSISRILESSSSPSCKRHLELRRRPKRFTITAKFPFQGQMEDGFPMMNLDQKILSTVKPRPFIYKSPKWTCKEREQLAKGIRQQNMRIIAEQIALKEKKNIEEEFERLKQLPAHELEMNVIGIDWERISTVFVPTRSAFDCKIQWTIHNHPMINKSQWSSEEADSLAEAVKAHPQGDWVKIAQALGTNRTAIQCFTYYQRHLNKAHLKVEWTKEEDESLRLAVEIYGDSNWYAVSNCLNGKQAQQCQSRWQKTLNPHFRKGKWTPEEDNALLEAVRLYGKQSWFKIQQFVPGRTDVQCRERYCNILDPELNQGPWESHEDELLLELVSQHGMGKWSTISKKIDGRTDNQCWRRWRQLHVTGKRNKKLKK